MLPPPPGRDAPKVLLRQKEVYKFWITLHRDFPKIERFGIGGKIEQSFLDLLELTFAAVYLSPEQKLPILGRSIVKMDNLKFFMQLAWESKLVPTEKYATLSKDLEEIGRMLGGWRKGIEEKLQQKTPIK